MKKIFTIMALACTILSVKGQSIVTVTAQNFNTTTSGLTFPDWVRAQSDGSPIGNTLTSLFVPTSSSPSSGYAGASGGFNVIIGNGSVPGINSFIFTSSGFNTADIYNLTVNFAARRTSTFTTNGTSGGVPNYPILEASTDGSQWTSLSYTHPTLAGSWLLAAGSGIKLSSNFSNQPQVYFRFSITTTTTGTGNYRIDDFTLIGRSLSSSSSITGFTLGGTQADINGNMINVTVPSGTNLSNIIASGTISTYATVNPDFASVTDFSGPVVFTVTAENLTTTSIYTVNATEAIALSSANSITGFALPGQAGASTITSDMVWINVPFGTALNSLAPTITISPAASVNPGSLIAQDFTSPVVYTVTAQNMEMAFYTVTVTNLPSVPGFNGVLETFSVYPTISGWSIYTPKSLKNWNWSSANGTLNANGYQAIGINPMESWVISPKLNFNGAAQSVGFGGSFQYSDIGTTKPAQILYSTDYIGYGPVSVAGWNIIADDYKGVVTVPGFKNFTASGTGYVAFRYISSNSSSSGAMSWTLDNVSITGASLFMPTTTGFVYNVEANIAPDITLTGITSLEYIRNSVSQVTGLSTLPGSLVVTIAGQLIGKNISANVGLIGGAQFSIYDGTGANTIRIPSTLNATLTSAGINLVEGNSLTVSGLIGHNNGLLQFTANNIISVDATFKPRPTPIDATIINEDLESKLIRVVAIVDSSSWSNVAGAGYNVNISVGGVGYIMRTYMATEIFGTKFTTLFGPKSRYKEITITGLAGQYDASSPYTSGYQLVPYLLSDFTTHIESTGNSIISFMYLPQPGLSTTVTGTITTVSGNNIEVILPAGSTVTGLIPTIEISDNATISPALGTAPNYVFVDPSYFVNYLVTSEAGTTKGYQLNVTISTITGIAESLTKADLVVYPNPASSAFKVVTKPGLVLEIYNTLGVKVSEITTISSETLIGNITAKGIYILKVKGSAVSQLIVIE